MLQLIRHIIAALVGFLATYLATSFNFVLDPAQQATIVVGVYAVVEKVLKRIWPDSAGV